MLTPFQSEMKVCHHFTQKEGIAPHPYRHVFDFIHEVDALRLGATLGQNAGVFSKAAKAASFCTPNRPHICVLPWRSALWAWSIATSGFSGGTTATSPSP